MDPKRANELYLIACEGEFFQGCASLGFSYLNAFGVDQDYAKAALFFSKACEAQIADGCLNIGFLYYLGNGVKKDREKGIKYIKMSCDMGDDYSCKSYDQCLNLMKMGY